jgi:hypothetical protein
MKTITLEKDNPTLVNLVEMAAEGVVVVNRGSKPAYVFMTVEKDDIQSWKLGENPEFLKIMRASWVRLQKAGGVSLAEARRSLLTDS